MEETNWNPENQSFEKKKSSVENNKNIINLEEFPILKKSLQSQNTKSPITAGKKAQQNSWVKVVTSISKSNTSKETFPVLPRTSDKNETTTSLECSHSSGITSYLDIQKYEQRKQPENGGHKKKSKKKGASQNSTTAVRNSIKVKRTDPVFINLSQIIQASNAYKKEKQHKNIKSKFQRKNVKEQLSGNYLDSSNPKRNRGKHREIKKKKFSKLKLTIIKERIIKQKLREKALNLYLGKECGNLSNEIDFKAEIQNYLKNLNKRKLDGKKDSENGISKDVNLNTEIKIKPDKKLVEDKNCGRQEIVFFKDNVFPDTILPKDVKFSSKLREYCDNLLTPELNSAVTVFIKELVKLQDKLFARDIIKAKAKKRHISGLKEVKKYLILKKVKMVIIAPNLEKLEMQGSIYDMINDLKEVANDQKVPYLFALNRYKLGRCTKKNVPVSAFGVLNYEGIENLYENVLDHLSAARNKFSELLKPKNISEEAHKYDKAKEVSSEVVSSFISLFRENLSLAENQNEE